MLEITRSLLKYGGRCPPGAARLAVPNPQRSATLSQPARVVAAGLVCGRECRRESLRPRLHVIPALFGDFVRYRLLEALAYVSTEIHKSFKPYFTPGATEDAKASAGQTILKRLTFIAERWNQDYLLGAGFSVADAYLFVMLMWARKNGLSLPVPLPAYLSA